MSQLTSLTFVPEKKNHQLIRKARGSLWLRGQSAGREYFEYALWEQEPSPIRKRAVNWKEERGELGIFTFYGGRNSLWRARK